MTCYVSSGMLNSVQSVSLRWWGHLWYSWARWSAVTPGSLLKISNVGSKSLFCVCFTIHTSYMPKLWEMWLNSRGECSVSLRSSWLPASAICQISSTVSSASSPQHFWDPCIFCRRTNCLELTAWSSAQSSCWLRNFGGTWRRICSSDIWSVSALEVLRNRTVQIDIYLLAYLLSCSVVHL